MTHQRPDVPHLIHPPVVLRAFTAADAPSVVEASRDAYIPATTTVPVDPDPGEVRAYLERQHERVRTGKGWSLAIADARTDACLGQIGLWPLGEGRASLGYWVAPSARRRGAAAAALTCLSRWALEEVGLARLELYVEPWNEGSLRAAAAAGYEQEGLMRSFREVAGPRRDMLLLARVPASAAAPAAVSLRGYEPADADATREVFSAAVRRTALSQYTEGQVRAWAPDDVDLYRWARRRALAWTVVAVEGGCVVGFADLTDAGELDMLFVHPDAARRGVATALVAAVTDEAARRALRRVDVRASRVLQPLLERLGFTLDADRPDNRVGGQVLANAAMHLDLPAPPEGHAADLGDGDVRDAGWNPLVPELLVRDLAASRHFYVDVVGFGVRYGRPDPPFAYLDLAGAQLMLEQDHDEAWRTGDLTGPRGRGVNLQVEVPDLAAVQGALAAAGVPLYRAPSSTTYDVGGRTETQRELLVQDPDGYLLRCVQVVDTPPPVSDHDTRTARERR